MAERAALPPSPSETPFLHLRWDGSRARARGLSHCTLGGELRPDGTRAPEGVFAEWTWSAERLTVRNDRYGFYPLFYAVRGGELWLSPSIPRLLGEGAPADLDDAALAVFLRVGTFLGDDTPFAAIRAVPPGARFVWEQGRLEARGTRPCVPVRSIERDAAVDAYVELFRAAIARYPADRERTVVPLTGGRDSRHILLELDAAGRAPSRCVTVRPQPPKNDQDVRVAAQLAAAVGVPHEVLEQLPSRAAAEWEKNERTSLCTLEHAWALPVQRYLAARGDLVVYDGIAGDTLSEAKYMNERRAHLLERRDLATYAAEELGTEGYLPVLLTRDAYRRFGRGLAAERLVAELETHVDAPNPVGSYRLWNRTRRAVAVNPFGLLAPHATVRTPFLDAELYDFLSSLPVRLLVDRTFHSSAIARACPRHAGIPYEDAGAADVPAAGLMRRFGVETLLAVLWGRPSHRSALLSRPRLLVRAGALLPSPSRAVNFGSVSVLATYLAQLEGAAAGTADARSAAGA